MSVPIAATGSPATTGSTAAGSTATTGASAAGLPAATPSGLPVVNQAFEPEWVRHGSAATQKAYESALSFEETLVEQLSQTLASTSGLGGEATQEGQAGGEGGSPAGTSQLSTMLPQALTASVMNAGGLGLAAQLTRDLAGADGAAQAKVTGGTGA